MKIKWNGIHTSLFYKLSFDEGSSGIEWLMLDGGQSGQTKVNVWGQFKHRVVNVGRGQFGHGMVNV